MALTTASERVRHERCGMRCSGGFPALEVSDPLGGRLIGDCLRRPPVLNEILPNSTLTRNAVIQLAANLTQSHRFATPHGGD